MNFKTRKYLDKASTNSYLIELGGVIDYLRNTYGNAQAHIFAFEVR